MSSIPTDSPAAAAKARAVESAASKEASNVAEAAEALLKLYDSKPPEKRARTERLVAFQRKVQDAEPSWNPAGDVENLDTTTLVEFASTLYGDEFVNTYFPREKGDLSKQIREFFQGFYGGDQCAGALKSRPFKPGESPCWICGFVIPGASTGGFRYECEHVLPIAQAVFFVDLYRGTKSDPAVSQRVLELEYDHSHRVCNQVKNNIHFLNSIPGDAETRTWSVDDARISGFLNKLYNNTSFYAPGEGNLLRTAVDAVGKKEWIAQRTKAISLRYNAILDATARRGDCPPGLFILSSLAVCQKRAEDIVSPTKPLPTPPSPPSTPMRPFKRQNTGQGRKTRRHRRRKNRKTRRHLPN